VSLIDETNYEILLSMEGGIPLHTDSDFDSSVSFEPWVWLMFGGDEEPWFRMTLEEAGRLHDRLGLILRRRWDLEDAEDKVDRVAAAIAKAADADYWIDEIAAWDSQEQWERDAQPQEEPLSAYEDREWFRKQARAVLEEQSS
jgi:hypothetical protein